MGRTDWTRAVKLLTYAERVDAFRLVQLSDSDRAKLMGGTLSRIYGNHRTNPSSNPRLGRQ